MANTCATGNRWGGLSESGQVRAGHELHRDVGEPLRFPRAINGHDVRVLQPPCGFCLFEKTFAGIHQRSPLKLLVQGQGFDRHHSA